MVGERNPNARPPSEWVETFARYYTPAVLGIAVAILLIPPLLLGLAWQDWLYRSLVLLVIGCPCALVISTPVSIVAALAASARSRCAGEGGHTRGVPAHIKAIAFDKTGTLTRGSPAVVEVVPLNEHAEVRTPAERVRSPGESQRIIHWLEPFWGISKLVGFRSCQPQTSKSFRAGGNGLL
jgi:Cd2+/Zn2+-exporting ATPase